MRILVTGYNGQLGYDVVREGEKHGLEMYGTGVKDLDITKEKEVYKFVKQLNPDVIIHCAAYTAVDKAEDDKEACWNVNVEGTKYLAQACKCVNAKFLYISTDYVFEGAGSSPYEETDETNPSNYYGLTKYEGELKVQEILQRWFIIRISWVFGRNGNNFVKTMLKLAEARDELSVVGDQVGSPTYTLDLAKLLLEMSKSEKYGIYHASNEGYCSWAEFAIEIFRQVNKDIKVHSISTEEYPTRAIRPRNSLLSKQKLIDSGFKPLPKWQDALKNYICEFTSEVK
jgi:dTDP-4-dehydrorhamnose reductase